MYNDYNNSLNNYINLIYVQDYLPENNIPSELLHGELATN